MRVLSIFLSICLFALIPTMGQEQALYQLPEKLLVQFDQQYRPYVLHEVSKKQTLYSIAKLYLQSEQNLSKFQNKAQLKAIKEYEWLKVPVDISFKQNKTSKALYYEVAAKETFYHILKHKTSFSRKEFEHLNPHIHHGIQAGHIVQIGWLTGQDEIKSQALETTHEPIIKKQLSDTITQLNHSEPVISAPIFKYNFEKRGVAARSRVELGKGRFYALHREVGKNKYIQILNPITGRSVQAKVIGKIPINFADDVEIVVSSEVARELWAIDKKFFVEVKYSK
ncbi:MAG: hypothetical protein IPI50_12010 [Saprospiraceae bacterium]|nr:hypothetical protein [Saprospiraceae bacterium]